MYHHPGLGSMMAEIVPSDEVEVPPHAEDDGFRPLLDAAGPPCTARSDISWPLELIRFFMVIFLQLN
jgi:hypothetical protein